MAWSTQRRATADDMAALELAAVRFCARHKIDTDGFGSAQTALDCATTPHRGCAQHVEDNARRLNRLWRRIVVRMFGTGVDGIAYGYIGSHVE